MVVGDGGCPTSSDENGYLASQGGGKSSSSGSVMEIKNNACDITVKNVSGEAE